MDMQQTLTVEEVSFFLKVSRLTIWKWCKNGKLPAFKLGGEWRIRRDDLESVIAEKLKASPARYAS